MLRFLPPSFQMYLTVCTYSFKKKLQSIFPALTNLTKSLSMATIWKFNLQFDTQSHGLYSYPLPVILYLWVKILVVRIARESTGTEISGVKCSFCRAGVKNTVST